jgi:quercetin dioxygenase-like cupin family protein
MITNNPANMSVRGASTETTRFYMDSLMSFLVKSSQTTNGLCLLEYRSHPGHEPPPHIHLDQDEAFYLLEGELEVYCMGQVVTARAGEALFLPRNQAHAWYVMSPKIRTLIMTNPGGMDEYFEANLVRGVASIQNTNAHQGNGFCFSLIYTTHIFCISSVMLHCLSHGSRNPGGLPRSMVSCFESRNREANDLPLDALL